MPKKQLYIIGELNKEGSRAIDKLVIELRSKGFIGTSLKSIPNHITLASFAIYDVESVLARMNKAAAENAAVEIEYSGIGISNDTLFLIPCFSRPLDVLHDSLALKEEVNWSPMTPVFSSDKDSVFKAAPILYNNFERLTAQAEGKKLRAVVDHLSLYEYSPLYYIERSKLL